jgi:hypothetical protein
LKSSLLNTTESPDIRSEVVGCVTLLIEKNLVGFLRQLRY